MKRISLASGETVPALGQGTWMVGDDPSRRGLEIATLRRGLDLGMTVIDTAEMYGDGRSEELVAEAIAGRRDEVFLVTKVYPHNASRQGVMRACERSLGRLATDRVDLYLLHWPGAIPLDETVDGFETLRRAGKIRYWGVSNFDVQEMTALTGLPDGRRAAGNQVLYNPARRGIEATLLPWCQRHGVMVMAYSPLDQGRIGRRSALTAIAQRHNVTPAQIALAWVLRQDGVMAIPKASRPEHVEANRQAAELTLTAADLAEIDRAYPPPSGNPPLEVI